MPEKMYEILGCTLTTIPGVNVITTVKILSKIGDIKRFGNAINWHSLLALHCLSYYPAVKVEM